MSSNQEYYNIVIEYLKNVANMYKYANKIEGDPKLIYRCGKRSISSFAEDEFAKCIKDLNQEVLKEVHKEVLGKECQYYINPSINTCNKFKKDRNVITCPDVIVVKKNTIVQAYDLKMDLGWKGNITEEFEKNNDIYGAVKGKDVSFNVYLNDSQERIDLKVSNKIKYVYVVLSHDNHNHKGKKNLHDEYSKICGRKPYNNLKYVVLTENGHLNRQKYKFNEGAVDVLIDYIKKVYKK